MNALDGLLVCDLSRVLAGPYCTMMLGDLGARVIKVESPRGGDDTRAWGPPFLAGESVYFLSINRNKESVTLDLKAPRGIEALWRLIERADILVENFRAGTLERLGFGYATCAARNPRLVYASVSGYGQTGPESDRPGYDLIAQGEGGIMSLTGDPEGQPFKTGVSYADITAGMWALNGVLAALYVRERTGRGQRVDAALLDGQIGLLGYQAAGYLATGMVPGRQGNRHPTITPYETFATSDGYLNVACGTDRQFQAFCGALERPALAAEARFARSADRVTHRAALERELAPLLSARPTAEWLTRLRAADVPAGAVRTVAEALDSAQVQARGMIVSVDHPTVGPLRLTGMPVQLSETPGRPRLPPPRLGEHSEVVLTGLLDYTKDEVRQMVTEGVTTTGPEIEDV